ncbi:MAG: phosphoribosyltransferase family protein [Candidatus Levyibacteriota bacterium]
MFKNREQVGGLLAQKLKSFEGKKDVLVLGIPRGGVVVAKIIAQRLKLILDIIAVKKIGAPSNPELAIGALGPKSMVYLEENLISHLGVSISEIKSLKAQKEKERKELEERLRGEKYAIDVKGKTIILVDDGVATGATVKCASIFLKKEKAKKIILAVPVISEETFDEIKTYFDQVIALSIEENFYAVGQFYSDFPQVGDNEVRNILKK